MDIIDTLWNLEQSSSISDLKVSVRSVDAKGQSMAAQLKRLREENEALKLRLGVLIRMMVERGVFSSGQFADSLNDAQKRISEARRQPQLARRKPPIKLPGAKLPGTK